MLFDPFEEKLYLPAAAIQIGNGLCRSGEVVGQEVESLAGLGIVVFDATKRLRVIGCRIDTGQHNRLIAVDTPRFVDRVRIAAFVLSVGLGANHEECPCQVEREKPFEIDIAAIHDTEGSGLWQQEVEDVDVVQLAVGDMDKSRDIAP